MTTVSEDKVVATGQGRVVGRRSTADSWAFLGIPYAEPPVGELRFVPPRRHEPWAGDRPAVAYGATPQRVSDPDAIIPEPSFPGDSTLTVNVFTPAPGDTAAKLPVLVWIHGGGYFAGSPASPWYDGRSFNRDGVVVVVVSYRLGFDGYGWVEGGGFNRALKDQIAALEWVQENVAAFGGDPAKVTLGGQSAGGGNALSLMVSPRTHGLFSAVICQSYSSGDLTAAESMDVAQRYAASFGVRPTLADLRAISEERIGDTQQEFNHVGRSIFQRMSMPVESASLTRELRAGGIAARTGLAFAPTIDDDILQGTIPDSFAAGAGATLPLLIGSNENEFAMGRSDDDDDILAGLSAAGVPESAIDSFRVEIGRLGEGSARGQLLGSYVMRAGVPVNSLARRAGGAAAHTWLYDFAGRASDTSPSLHCLELPFVFDHLDAPGVSRVLGDSPPRDLAAQMHRDWVQFVTAHTLPWDPVGGSPRSARRYENSGFRDDHDAYRFESDAAALAQE